MTTPQNAVPETTAVDPKEARILVIGDSSTKKTGFAVAKRQLLDNLYEAHYNIAELGFAGSMENKAEVPWKYYPVVPTDKDSKEYSLYGQNPKYKQGGGRWNDVCLHYKPNLVVMFCDPWDVDTMVFSHYKKFYKTLLYVPLDSGPVNAHLASIHNASDYVVSFTEFGKQQLEAANCTVDRVISPGFKKVSVDRDTCKKALGIPVDSTVFGWVGRNQPRKRVLELIKAFEKHVDAGNSSSYLYLHTGLVDVSSWDLPSILVNSKHAHKILFTYKNTTSQDAVAMPYKDLKVNDGKHLYYACDAESRVLSDLSVVYGAMDCYVQAANCEGFGIPIAEAAAHGVPNICVDHTAMGEVCRNTKGKPVAPASLLYEPIISTLRAAVDIDALAKAFDEIPQTVEHYYTKEKSAKAWEEMINSVELEDLWDSPSFIPDTNHPTAPMSISSFMSSGNLDSYATMQLLYDSYRSGQHTSELVDRSNKMRNLIKKMEAARLGRIQFEEKDWMK